MEGTSSNDNGFVKKIVWVVILLVAVWGIYSFSTKSSQKETGPIKIGFIGPLSGDAASVGEPIKNGVELAVKEINANGGIDGRQIEAVYEDGKCNGKDAASVAQKLVNIDKVKYIVGGICSPEAFAFYPITTVAKVFTIMPGASAPKLSGVSPFLMRNNPNDNLVGVALADFLVKSYKNVYTITEQTEFAQGIEAVFLAQSQKVNLVSVGVQGFESKTTDFRSILLKVKEVNPDVVFINVQTPPNLLKIAQQARQLGIKSQFISTSFGPDPAVQAAGSSVEGMIFADAPGLASDGAGKELFTKYKNAYGKDPSYAFYVGAAYDAVYLVSKAISSVGDDTNKVQEYMHKVSNYVGTIGTYSFDKNGDIVGIVPIFEKIVNGKLVRI